MRIFPSPKFTRMAKKLFKKRPELQYKSERKIDLLSSSRDDPSLELHKLKGELGDYWSISVEADIRITFMYASEGIILLKIGKHEEVY